MTRFLLIAAFVLVLLWPCNFKPADEAGRAVAWHALAGGVLLLVAVIYYGSLHF